MLEPTYRRIKRALIDGIWPGGTRLEALRLAEEFGVSMTPVRDSLNQLVGEGLVDLTPGEGFRVPILTEQGLRDILHVNLVLLETVTHKEWRLPGASDIEDWPHDYAGRVTASFSAIAAGSSNRFLAALIDRISDRLHHVRIHEPDILPDAAEILSEIEASLRGSRNQRSSALQQYHNKCQKHAFRLINVLTE